MEHHRQSSPAKFHQRLIEMLSAPQAWPPGALSVPEMQAHRGYWLGGERENTLGAFVAAKARGAQMIELDVRLTADHQVVVFHDQDTERFSTEKLQVGDLTFQALKEKVGGLPLLQEVLTHPQVPAKVNIELKSEKVVDEALERKAWQVVQQVGAEGRVLFSSFNPFSLWRMSLFTRQVPLALLVTPEANSQFLREMWMLPLLSLHLLHVDQTMADDAFLSFWQGKGFPISVWTVNDRQKIKAFLQKACLSVISDQVFSPWEEPGERVTPGWPGKYDRSDN